MIETSCEKKTLRYLNDYPSGNKEDMKSALIKKGVLSAIFEDIYEELGLIGVIQYGCDGLGRQRYQLTPFGKDYCDSLLFSDTFVGLAS